MSFSNQSLSDTSLGHAEASSAYQTWDPWYEWSTVLMSGRVAIAYMNIDSGSPCVIPFLLCNIDAEPFRTKEAQPLYVLNKY